MHLSLEQLVKCHAAMSKRERRQMTSEASAFAFCINLPAALWKFMRSNLLEIKKKINKHKQTEKQDGKEQERNRNETQKQKHTNTYKTIIQFHKTQQHILYICCFCYSICLYVVYCFDLFVSLFLYVCVAFSLLFFHVFLNTR